MSGAAGAERECGEHRRTSYCRFWNPFPNRAELAPKVYGYHRARAAAAQCGCVDGGDSAPAVRARQAADRGAQRRGISRATGAVGAALFRRILRGGAGLAARSGYRGDAVFLPALQLLTGFGFLLMVSMRDPLRDTLEFHKFAIGVFLGVAAARAARVRGLRLPPPFGLVLHAAVRRAGAVRSADGVRARTGGQRRQSESRYRSSRWN